MATNSVLSPPVGLGGVVIARQAFELERLVVVCRARLPVAGQDRTTWFVTIWARRLGLVNVPLNSKAPLSKGRTRKAFR